jgi:ATP-dependent exoDNAse (exonuclease V) alpha subunit
VIHHLNVRVAWHDNRWNGAVCRKPSENSFCVDLDRIRENRDDGAEDAIAGRYFQELRRNQLPPCIAESGAFMSDREWWRSFDHPYQSLPKTQGTHGHLLATQVEVPPYSTFAVPFLWMLRESQERIDNSLPTPLPPDEEPPFTSPWVFSAARQEAISQLFFDRLTAEKSLVFFYTKSGHPLGDNINRLVVGAGQITKIGGLLRYDTKPPGAGSYPMWDRLISHSIRPDGHEGFLIPYHDYLGSTGDPEEDMRRAELLSEIAVVPEASSIMAFSYAGEHAAPDVALSTLVSTLESIRAVRRHGFAPGPWDRREEWINEQIAHVWADRGAFPGAGSVLEALGMRLGTALVLELLSSGAVKSSEDPWPLLDAILRGNQKPPQPAYEGDIVAAANTWATLDEEQRSLVHLLSRFALSPLQARRWFDPRERRKAVRSPATTAELLENPYRIVELDLGDATESPVSLGVVDRGIMPDAVIAAAHPTPPPSRVDSPGDQRRVRAAFVTVLRNAADNGDALLTEDEALDRVAHLRLDQPCHVPSAWIAGNRENLAAEVDRLEVLLEPEGGTTIAALQLVELKKREDKVRSILSKRAARQLLSLEEDWSNLITAAVGKGDLAAVDDRHRIATLEQAAALEQLTTRKLSVLVGRAGTGKTTVLGALLKSDALVAGGMLFLAPTGKARVRLGQKTGATAMTVAQFLYQLGRYDGPRQRPLFEGTEQYRREKTVVIDECSMLTLDDLAAVLYGLDLAHVERLILVGDPNQLPPIGVGRPFADLVEYLNSASSAKEPAGGAISRLTTEVRTTAGAPSDALRLASWYTRETQAVDADRVLSDLELGNELNDLTLETWTTPDELRTKLRAHFILSFNMSSPEDVAKFNTEGLGLTQEGWVPFDDHDGAERFQILSPVRGHPYGVNDLNRWVQKAFRSVQLQAAKQPWGVKLGDEEIVWGDKVILVKNGKTKGWNGLKRQPIEEYLANGEIGVTATSKLKGTLNVAFANRPDVRFSYFKRQFSGGSGPLQLAYALTVHKAQGSEFDTVFVILPKNSRLMTRELLYTALTRSRTRLVLFIEGTDPTFLYDLTRPERSETARRNTNLFRGGVRRDLETAPYAEHLVHRTLQGELVRSKSELVIANHLHSLGLQYHYERPLDGTLRPGRLRPDFSFIDDSGEVIVLEHLGMLDRSTYRESWDWKLDWYKANGYNEGVNLFTTDEVNGLDMESISNVARQIQSALD